MSHEEAAAPQVYGMVAEFESPDQLLEAAKRAKEAGYRKIEGYSPFPVHGLAEAVGCNDNRVPWIIFGCGVLGAIIGLSLQYYVSVVDYPLNVGGRPLFSWPHFVPVIFECTVLLAAFGAVFGMFGLNGLPRPHHPVFNAPGFLRASQDRFFLAIEAEDPRYDPEEIRRFMVSLGASSIAEVDCE